MYNRHMNRFTVSAAVVVEPHGNLTPVIECTLNG